MFILIPTSEEVKSSTRPLKVSRDTNNKKNNKKIKLIKEVLSNGNPNKCQVFQMWKVGTKKIACCTDNRTTPLTLCIDDQGNEFGEVN